MAVPSALVVLNAVFFFFDVRRVLEDLLRTIISSLPYAEMAHSPYAYDTMFATYPLISGASGRRENTLWQTVSVSDPADMALQPAIHSYTALHRFQVTRRSKPWQTLPLPLMTSY